MKSIYGALNYYRQYIKDFATKTHPWQRLMSKKYPFLWTARDGDILKAVTNELADACLAFVPDGGQFRLETDASDVAWGGVLYNKEEYDVKKKLARPLLFVSKSFSPAE